MGNLLMDFHSFPLRIMEVPDKPQEAILKVGFSDGIYGRSKGGMTFSGWKCEHLPYLVEIDNWGVSKQPGQAKAGGIWIWGYDEITWFAHQSQQYRSNWLQLRLGLGAADGHQWLSSNARQPHAGFAAGPQTMVLRQQSQPGRPRGIRRRGRDSCHLGNGVGRAATKVGWDSVSTRSGRSPKLQEPRRKPRRVVEKVDTGMSGHCHEGCFRRGNSVQHLGGPCRRGRVSNA